MGIPTRIPMASSSPTNCPPFEFSAKYYHVDGGSCVRQSSFFGGQPVLNQAVGYSVILGFGAFFALFTSFLVLFYSHLLLDFFQFLSICIFYISWFLGLGMVGKEVRRFAPYIRMVQHSWEERQDRPYRQCHCFSGNNTTPC